MITYDDSVSAHRDAERALADQHEPEPTYEHILRTLQICPLGQEDDARHLTRSVILGEN